MPRFFPCLPLFALALAAASPALGDACRDEIAALYDGGALDPFARPPHRQTVQQFDANGTPTRTNLNLVETPLRTIAGVNGEQFTMAIDRDLWNGPTPEGPWTALGYQMPDGREEGLRAGMAQEAENLTDTLCHGTTDAGLVHYTYRTQTNPDAQGMFYGARYDTFVDPASGMPARMEMTEFVNSWTEGVSGERHVIDFEYDPGLRVVAPD